MFPLTTLPPTDWEINPALARNGDFRENCASNGTNPSNSGPRENEKEEERDVLENKAGEVLM